MMPSMLVAFSFAEAELPYGSAGFRAVFAIEIFKSLYAFALPLFAIIFIAPRLPTLRLYYAFMLYYLRCR